MALQNWATSLTRIVDRTVDQKIGEGGGPRLRLVLAGALGLRMTSFLESVRTHLSDWIRIYLHFIHDTAQLKYTAVMKVLLVGSF